MLGYIQTFKPELKVRELEIYTGYYCGICKYIGKNYGQLPRMSLSYDAAFLALLIASISAERDVPTREHCIAHHIKKKTIIRNSAIEYAGDLMLILAWYKLSDDASDEGKGSAKATMVLLRRIFTKLQRKQPKLCEGIAEHLSRLTALEKAKCDSLDAAAEAFAKIMEVIFREGICYMEENHEPEDENNTNLHEAFAKIGYHIGKWVYLMDAADDIEENVQSGCYNPLIYRFDFRGCVSGDETLSRETVSEFRERITERISFNLYHYLSIIGQEVSALDIKKNKGIIENIIYFGMNRKTEEILTRSSEEKGENE